jgi:hypothetical protein
MPPPELLWHALLITAFVIGTGWNLLFIVVAPAILGSHAIVYTDAAAALAPRR